VPGIATDEFECGGHTGITPVGRVTAVAPGIEIVLLNQSPGFGYYFVPVALVVGKYIVGSRIYRIVGFVE
jgi:hypothetical protein